MCQGSITDRHPLSPETIRAERQRLRELLRAGGHAVTARRMAMYDVLLETNDHICAEHILEALGRAHAHWRVNKTTVYRTLDLFASLGLLYEMKRDDGRAQYELALHGPHGHLICEVCGDLQDLDEPLATALRHDLAARYGFQADLFGHALQGVCARCQRARGD